MMVNAKLERTSGGEDNIKSWIAKLPSDDDVSIFNYLWTLWLSIATNMLLTGCLVCYKANSYSVRHT